MCMVATVGPSIFLVASSKHGNIILEGLALKLDTLMKLSGFMLAKMGIDEKILPRMLRQYVSEGNEFLKRKEKGGQ